MQVRSNGCVSFGNTREYKWVEQSARLKSISKTLGKGASCLAYWEILLSNTTYRVWELQYSLRPMVMVVGILWISQKVPRNYGSGPSSLDAWWECWAWESLVSGSEGIVVLR